MSRLIRVLVVDEPTLVRRGIVALLNHRRRLQVVGEASDAEEALALTAKLQPDVVVVEPAVPGGGPALVEQICQAVGNGAVIVLTHRGDADTVTPLLRHGIRGYLLKDCEPEDLARTIEHVYAGELVIAQKASEVVVRDLTNLTNRPHRLLGPTSLTERELTVLRLVARGRRNPEIARELCISEHTVKGHLNKLLNKLGLENRVQLASYAIQHGLADPHQYDDPGSNGSSLPLRSADHPSFEGS